MVGGLDSEGVLYEGRPQFEGETDHVVLLDRRASRKREDLNDFVGLQHHLLWSEHHPRDLHLEVVDLHRLALRHLK